MEIIDTVVQIQFDEKIITPNNIIKSFETTGISINLDGSEQHMVKKNDEIWQEIILPNDVILNEDEMNNIQINMNNNNLFKMPEIKELDNEITDYFNIEKKDYMMDIDELLYFKLYISLIQKN